MKALSIILTCALLGVMGWLIFSSNNDARLSNAKSQLSGQNAQPAATNVSPNDTAQIAALERAAQTGQPQPSLAAPPQPYTPAGAPSAGPTMVGSTPKVTAALEAAAAAPLPETPRQRQIAAAPTLAKIMEYQKDYGVVGITAGTDRKIEVGMGFAIRRNKSIIARVKVLEVEGTSAVASVDARSVPPGVLIEVGDEIIQDLPPES